jgi:transposase
MKVRDCGISNKSNFLFVGDSALYEKCVVEDKNSQTGPPMLWLSRVPSTIKKAKALLALPDQAVNWTQLDTGYKIHSCESKYGNVPQRWLLVLSEQAYAREGATLDRTVEKEYAAMEQKLDQLSRTVFNCIEDAKKALAHFLKSLKYHTVKASMQATTGYQDAGRPKKKENNL